MSSTRGGRTRLDWFPWRPGGKQRSKPLLLQEANRNRGRNWLRDQSRGGELLRKIQVRWFRSWSHQKLRRANCQEAVDQLA